MDPMDDAQGRAGIPRGELFDDGEEEGRVGLVGVCSSGTEGVCMCVCMYGWVRAKASYPAITD